VSFIDKKTISQKYVELRKKLYTIFYEFSLFERLLVILVSIVLVVTSTISFIKLNDFFTQEIPKEGGSFTEGLIGTPRFINPVLATSDLDRDLTALVYSGLLKLNSSGDLIPDLVESYTVSEDGLTYYFKIKEDAKFHDGKKVTADDVIFTITKIQDPTMKSPRRPNWEGVRMEKISDNELEFSLNTPYAPFIFNTTIGILPEHIWSNITNEQFTLSAFNTKSIGSGPYLINQIKRDENEIITSYTLTSFSNYAIKEPFISKITFNFYKSENDLLTALNKKQIDSAHSISPSAVKDVNKKHKQVIDIPISRIFALFFNQNKSDLLTDKTVRQALNVSIDRSAITDNILHGYATNLYSPLSLFSGYNPEQIYSVEEAKKILGNKNFEGQTLKISTNNVPELIAVGEKITQTFKELGLNTELEIKDTNELAGTVIRPREYQAILFGNVINRDLDYYAFWHSSQRNDPGLNLASYTSIESDKALDQARNVIDLDEKIKLLQKFEKEVINDAPAIFLYSPDFIYIVPQIIHAQFPQIVVTSSDRFADVHNWYIETEKVWKIFLK
jgi:peptide/nickel transport system substrate-binding protein